MIYSIVKACDARIEFLIIVSGRRSCIIHNCFFQFLPCPSEWRAFGIFSKFARRSCARAASSVAFDPYGKGKLPRPGAFMDDAEDVGMRDSSSRSECPFGMCGEGRGEASSLSIRPAAAP